MFAFTSSFARRFIVPLTALLLVVLGSSLPAFAAAPPDSPQQAQQRYAEAKIRSWSRSVLKLALVGHDGMLYTGTGVYVTNGAGDLYLITADHVLRDQAGQMGRGLFLRPFNSDPDAEEGWMNIDEVAASCETSGEFDLAVFPLKSPIPGMVPARVAEIPASAGDLVLAFGFGSDHGRVLVGQIRGAASNAPFLAARLGAGHGDSGGPVFDIRTGEVIGIISSDADPEMTDRFSRQVNGDGQVQSTWARNGNALGADTLIVHLPAIINR